MTSADPEPLDNRGSGGGGVAPEVLVEGGWGGRGGADLGEQDGHGAGGRDQVGRGGGGDAFTAAPTPTPPPSRNSRAGGRWASVRWLVIMCRTELADSSWRPFTWPVARSIRAKRSQSPAVLSRPPPPDSNAGRAAQVCWASACLRAPVGSPAGSPM